MTFPCNFDPIVAETSLLVDLASLPLVTAAIQDGRRSHSRRGKRTFYLAPRKDHLRRDPLDFFVEIVDDRRFGAGSSFCSTAGGDQKLKLSCEDEFLLSKTFLVLPVHKINRTPRRVQWTTLLEKEQVKAEPCYQCHVRLAISFYYRCFLIRPTICCFPLAAWLLLQLACQYSIKDKNPTNMMNLSPASHTRT